MDNFTDPSKFVVQQVPESAIKLNDNLPWVGFGDSAIMEYLGWDPDSRAILKDVYSDASHPLAQLANKDSTFSHHA